MNFLHHRTASFAMCLLLLVSFCSHGLLLGYTGWEAGKFFCGTVGDYVAAYANHQVAKDQQQCDVADARLLAHGLRSAGALCGLIELAVDQNPNKATLSADHVAQLGINGWLLVSEARIYADDKINLVACQAISDFEKTSQIVYRMVPLLQMLASVADAMRYPAAQGLRTALRMVEASLEKQIDMRITYALRAAAVGCASKAVYDLMTWKQWPNIAHLPGGTTIVEPALPPLDPNILPPHPSTLPPPPSDILPPSPDVVFPIINPADLPPPPGHDQPSLHALTHEQQVLLAGITDDNADAFFAALDNGVELTAEHEAKIAELTGKGSKIRKRMRDDILGWIGTMFQDNSSYRAALLQTLSDKPSLYAHLRKQDRYNRLKSLFATYKKCTDPDYDISQLNANIDELAEAVWKKYDPIKMPNQPKKVRPLPPTPVPPVVPVQTGVVPPPPPPPITPIVPQKDPSKVEPANRDGLLGAITGFDRAKLKKAPDIVAPVPKPEAAPPVVYDKGFIMRLDGLKDKDEAQLKNDLTEKFKALFTERRILARESAAQKDQRIAGEIARGQELLTKLDADALKSLHALLVAQKHSPVDDIKFVDKLVAQSDDPQALKSDICNHIPVVHNLNMEETFRNALKKKGAQISSFEVLKQIFESRKIRQTDWWGIMIPAISRSIGCSDVATDELNEQQADQLKTIVAAVEKFVEWEMGVTMILQDLTDPNALKQMTKYLDDECKEDIVKAFSDNLKKP